MNIDTLIEKAHKNAVEKKFWEEEHHIGLTLALIITEIAEALESARIDNYAVLDDFTELDLLSEIHNGSFTEMGEKLFEEKIKDTFEDEIADTFIRLADLCGKYKIDISKFIKYKMIYNKTRPAKHNKLF